MERLDRKTERSPSKLRPYEIQPCKESMTGPRTRNGNLHLHREYPVAYSSKSTHRLSKCIAARRYTRSRKSFQGFQDQSQSRRYSSLEAQSNQRWIPKARRHLWSWTIRQLPERQSWNLDALD